LVTITKRRGRAELIAFGGPILVGAILGIGTILRRPDIVFNARWFLFLDPGYNLLVAQVLSDGGTLYKDVAYPYGPLPAYAFAGFSAIFGNSPLSYTVFHLVLSLADLSLACALLRSALSPGWVAVVATIGLVPTMVYPGTPVLFAGMSAYVPLERLGLLLVALLWTPPATRTHGRALSLGVVLGLWQTVKFGGAFVAGLAVVILDLLMLGHARRVSGDAPRVRGRWLGGLLVVLVGFLAVEACLVAWAFWTLPERLARDLVWPWYMRSAYPIAPPRARWILWDGIGPSLDVQLALVVGAVVSLVALCRNRTRPRLLLPALFFVVATAGYFRAAIHFEQHGWELILASAWVLEGGGLGRLAPLGWLPGFASVVHVALVVPAPLSTTSGAATAWPWRHRLTLPYVGRALQRPLDLPGGARLWDDASSVETVHAIVRTLGACGVVAWPAGRPPERAALVLGFGAGFLHFFRIPYLTRYSWYQTGFVRPYEEDALIGSLDRTTTLVVPQQWVRLQPFGRYRAESGRPPPTPDVRSWARDVEQLPRFYAALVRRLGPPVLVRDWVWVFPVGSPDGGSGGAALSACSDAGGTPG
jgi:hypothetical protein